VVVTGNEIGLSQAQFVALPEGERRKRCAAARHKFAALGAHYVIGSTAELLPVIDDLNDKIARGERP